MPVRLALFALVLATTAQAQPAPTIARATLRAFADSSVEWRGYAGRPRSARVRVFANAADDREDRPFTVVVDDRAGNPRPVTEEAPFLAETLGRALGIDPTRLVFVFRFSAASFAEPAPAQAGDAPDRGKALHLRATFRRNASGALSSPSWRALSPDETEDHTDRALR